MSMSPAAPPSSDPRISGLSTIEQRSPRSRDPELTVKDLRFGMDELINSAEVTQNFAKTIGRLESGEAERFIITSRNEFRAILVSMEHYLRLLNAAR